MRAIVRDSYGGPEHLVVREVPIPEPSNGDIRIRVKAFGVNRAETYMRRGTWGDVAAISGIECVGVVDADPSGQFSTGHTVAAIMGGLGRTRPGSYAEFTCAPATNVFVCHDADGYYAVDAGCTHLGCDVALKAGGDLKQWFACPCHGATYDANGQNPTTPAPLPLKHYALCVQPSGTLLVDVTEAGVDPKVRLKP